jgi:hypothetical protein
MKPEILVILLALQTTTMFAQPAPAGGLPGTMILTPAERSRFFPTPGGFPRGAPPPSIAFDNPYSLIASNNTSIPYGSHLGTQTSLILTSTERARIARYRSFDIGAMAKILESAIPEAKDLHSQDGYTLDFTIVTSGYLLSQKYNERVQFIVFFINDGTTIWYKLIIDGYYASSGSLGDLGGRDWHSITIDFPVEYNKRTKEIMGKIATMIDNY